MHLYAAQHHVAETIPFTVFLTSLRVSLAFLFIKGEHVCTPPPPVRAPHICARSDEVAQDMVAKAGNAAGEREREVML